MTKKFSELPVEIQEAMLKEQVRQGNPRDKEVFEENIKEMFENGGFSWIISTDGYDFWDKITNGDYTEFYNKYPKQPIKVYPRVMMVSDVGSIWTPRVVFMEKAGHFLAWTGAETIEEAKSEMTVIPWKYAKEIEEKKFVELTMQEIADKFGCSVERIKIKL